MDNNTVNEYLNKLDDLLSCDGLREAEIMNKVRGIDQIAVNSQGRVYETNRDNIGRKRINDLQGVQNKLQELKNENNQRKTQVQNELGPLQQQVQQLERELTEENEKQRRIQNDSENLKKEEKTLKDVHTQKDYANMKKEEDLIDQIEEITKNIQLEKEKIANNQKSNEKKLADYIKDIENQKNQTKIKNDQDINQITIEIENLTNERKKLKDSILLGELEGNQLANEENREQNHYNSEQTRYALIMDQNQKELDTLRDENSELLEYIKNIKKDIEFNIEISNLMRGIWNAEDGEVWERELEKRRKQFKEFQEGWNRAKGSQQGCEVIRYNVEKKQKQVEEFQIKNREFEEKNEQQEKINGKLVNLSEELENLLKTGLFKFNVQQVVKAGNIEEIKVNLTDFKRQLKQNLEKIRLKEEKELYIGKNSNSFQEEMIKIFDKEWNSKQDKQKEVEQKIENEEKQKKEQQQKSNIFNSFGLKKPEQQQQQQQSSSLFQSSIKMTNKYENCGLFAGKTQDQSKKPVQQKELFDFSKAQKRTDTQTTPASTLFQQQPQQQQQKKEQNNTIPSGNIFNTGCMKENTPASTAGSGNGSGNGIFGQQQQSQQQQSQSSGNIFNQQKEKPQQQQPSNAVFGGAMSQPKPGGGLFGNSQINSGGTNLFQNKDEEKKENKNEQKTNLFGNQNQQPSGLFGGGQNSLLQQNQQQQQQQQEQENKPEQTSTQGVVQQSQQSSNMFGNVSSSNIFGNKNNEQKESTSSNLFGNFNNNTNTNLFGNKNEENKEGGLFSKKN